MQIALAKNGLGKLQKANPKPKKSVLELSKSIPFGRYRGLSGILESYEIPKERK